MSLQEYEQYEESRVHKNAWHAAEVIKDQIQDAPVLSDYIKSFVSDQEKDMSFFSQDLIHEFSRKTSDAAKEEVQGSNYIRKVLIFIESHHKVGELFMEYLKGSCKSINGELCRHCEVNGWIGPDFSRIPQPVPDSAKPIHYLDVFRTSVLDKKGEERLADDWQPRVYISKAFNEGLITLDDDKLYQS